ncbi:chemotaxis protein CheD [Halococcoides cellulosivorans]|uniref:Probable chemoreceptor glutamine deamidase CheD n=1 Tax=Halococcoides cellulosivorans TaxID=1679096 RepID=A0A2R4WZR2_9EURY|nr:chemotaxis protein CheD [Halococcoides cellulosivorans]AWB27046.1 chemotaxis protein CheD [Halococcoides cellulosivorans]
MKVYDSTRTTGQETTPDRLAVGIAEYAVGTGEAVLTTSGLGSCVGIAIYDRPGGVGGLLHAMLPHAEDGTNGAPAKYVDAGVEALLAELASAGADRDALDAKIAGGSDMLDFSGDSIGSRNVAAARETLERVDVPIVAEDAGGDQGRSLRFALAEGVLEVKSAREDPLRL